MEIKKAMMLVILLSISVISGCIGGNENTSVEKNNPPTCFITANLTSGYSPLTVTFHMSANDSDGNISFWKIDADSDRIAGDSGSGGPPSTFQYTYQNPGTYYAKLVVKDNDGSTSIQYITIIVKNHHPTVSVSANPTTGEAPLTVHFTGSWSDMDGTITSHKWYFGDGHISYERNPTHTFMDDGTYNARLEVRDNDGDTSSDTVTITVSPHERTVGDEVTFTNYCGLLLQNVKTTVDYVSVSDSGYVYTHKPDNPNYGYLWVYIKVKNYGSDVEQSFSKYWMKVTVSGVEYERDTPSYSIPNLYESVDLNPNAITEGWIIYSIPKDSKDIKFAMETQSGDITWKIPDSYIQFQERNLDNLADGQFINYGSNEDYYRISITHEKTVYSYQWQGSSGYMYTEEASPGNKFVFLYVNSKNMGSSKIDVPSPYDMKLVVGDKQYSYVSYYGENSYRDSSGVIHPGVTAEGYVVFEIPEEYTQGKLIVELTSSQDASWALTF